jgi:hypothetical protein
LWPLPFPFPRFFGGGGSSTRTGVVVGGGSIEVVAGGGTVVLVVTGSGVAGRDAESTMNAIEPTNTAITAAATSHHRDR